MRVLVFGAGPLGSLYAHRLYEAGIDVKLLARGERRDWLEAHGVQLVNEMTGERSASQVPVVGSLAPDDDYDLVLVLVRKNRLGPVFDLLAASPGIGNILFMGNNALGFDDYLAALPADRVLFGFPGAGGGLVEQVVHYADRERPRGKPRAVTIGEIDGVTRERTLAIKSLFESAGLPVDLTPDIDGWLKYHVAKVSPLVGALYKHGCDNQQLAVDRETLRALVRAAKEGGRVLQALGYTRRQPFDYNLFYWLPEAISLMAVKGMLQSRFADVAFAMHARAARGEMVELALEFQQLAAATPVDTPSIDALRYFTLQA